MDITNQADFGSTYRCFRLLRPPISIFQLQRPGLAASQISVARCAALLQDLIGLLSF